MLIEIHMLQNHSPANLNRDDLGAPKSCLFGGVARARISSQCLKRSIRRSPEFQAALEQGGGVRTRRLISEIARRASDGDEAPEPLVKLVAEAFEKGGSKRDATKEDPHATAVLWYLPECAIDEMAAAAAEAHRAKHKPDQLCEALAAVLRRDAKAPDIALCGRMTELEAKGAFKDIDFRVEAALSAAHALSTHEVVNEVDYFTAVDDLAAGTGAGHVNEGMFASACFYKYFAIHWELLVGNLAGDVDLAAKTVRHFLHAAALTTPSGKQTSFAAFNPPEGILVEVKAERCTPVSYANAFADPVPPRAARGLVGESVARLGQHVHELAVGYGLEARRLWFSPAGRHALQYVESGQEHGVVCDGDSFGTLDGLTEALMASVTTAAGV